MKESLSPKEQQQKFIEVWGFIHNDIRKYKYWMENTDFSNAEKKLLRAFYHYKKNKKKECLELIKSKLSDNSFLEGIRYYLIGLTYNQFGHFIYAIENLNQSIKLFEDCEEENFIVNPLSVLALAYCNRREELNMAAVLDKLLTLNPKTPQRRLQIQYAEFSYFYLSNQFPKAKLKYRKLEDENLPEFDSYRPYFMIILFMFNVREKNYPECYRIMDKYSALSGHVVKVNYIYNKTLLDFIVHDSPLYIYARDYDETPELHHQLEVIKALQSGDLDRANLFWAKLAKHNPDLYMENFVSKNEDSLFTQALKKLRSKGLELSFDPEELKKLPTKLMKLDYILINSSIPVSHARLLELIYAEKVSDLSKSKLRRLIADYSKIYGHKIKSFQATYQIKKKVS